MPNLPDEPTLIDSDEEDYYAAQGEWFDNNAYWFPQIEESRNYSGERG